MVEYVRLGIAFVILVVSFIIAFERTPDLDKVENRFFYRVAFAMWLARGVTNILFHEALGLFPLG